MRFLGKKVIKYYVRLIISRSVGEYTVKFMKKSGDNKFIFPEREDVSVVDAHDICRILGQPEVNNSHQYILSDLDELEFNIY